jgi:hypothetical protein
LRTEKREAVGYGDRDSGFLAFEIRSAFWSGAESDKKEKISGSYAWNKKVRRTVSAITKRKEYVPSPLVSFHFRRSGRNTSPNLNPGPLFPH